MELPEKQIARQIIEHVGNSGQPPPHGFQYFNAGPDIYFRVLESEYLSTFIKDGGSIFKVLLGVYGGGKTHFLYTLRDIAWKHKFAVSYVKLSPRESPFHKLELVYRAIVEGVIPPVSPEELLSGYEQGTTSFIKSWFAATERSLTESGLTGATLRTELEQEAERIDNLASISFQNAIRAAFRALIKQDQNEFNHICQWIKCEGIDRTFHKRYGISQRIDGSTAFQMIRSVSQWVRLIGYSGLLILFDEGERHASLSSGQREQHLTNMREVIDECTNTAFKGIMMVYAVPDDNFLNGKTMVYQALSSRLETVFDTINPAGVRIELEKIVTEPIAFLTEVGRKLSVVYERAYDFQFDPDTVGKSISAIADSAYQRRFADEGYKRHFVLEIVREFNRLRLSPETVKA